MSKQNHDFTQSDLSTTDDSLGDASFYRSSNNLNSLHHAKNFRNSLFLKDPINVDALEFDSDGNLVSEGAAEERIYRGSGTSASSSQNHNYQDNEEEGDEDGDDDDDDDDDEAFRKRFEESFYSFDNSSNKANRYGSDIDDDEFDDKEDNNETYKSTNEVQTQTIQFSSSPSLSALAGVLKNNIIDIPKVDTLDKICEEDEESIEETELEAYPQALKKDIIPRPQGNPQQLQQKAETKVPLKPTKHIKQYPPVTTKQTIATKPKKKSIFSIFKKKQNLTVTEPLPVSETFSGTSSLLKQTAEKTKKDSVETNGLGLLSSMKKFNRSRTSISTEREAKDGLKVTKNRTNSITSTINTEKTDDSPVKRNDIGQRKPTPLNFEHNIEHKNQSKQENDTGLETPKLKGDDLFPKFLDPSDLESIKSLETKRFSYNSKNGSKRRSLNESISINAHNEGMYIEEAGDMYPISTPDLTKSPASSILRNGRFENDNQRNSYNFSDGTKSNRNSYAFSDGTKSNRNSYSFNEPPAITVNQRRSSSFDNKKPLSASVGNTESSLSSVRIKDVFLGDEQLVTKDYVTVDDGAFDRTDISHSFLNSEYEDSEYVSEIMEFASIIDFGGDLDLNLDINPSTNILGLHKLPHVNEKFEAREQTYDSSRPQTTATNINTQSTDPILKLETPKLHNGAFDYDEIMDFSPTARAYIPEVTANSQGSRPLSMSFKGLHHDNQLNQSPSFNSVSALSHESQEENFIDEDLMVETSHIAEHADMNNSGDLENIASNSEEDTPWEKEQTLTTQSYVPEFSFENDFNPEPSNSGYLSESSNKVGRRIRFSSKIILYETFSETEYDRRPDLSTCNQLTPQLAVMIRDEMNELKRTMEVHESSSQYTHYF